MAFVAMTAAAQDTRTGYFNDGYMYRHNMNPAISNRQSYFAMPALGDINVSQRGNIGLGDLVYNSGGKTVTFMHPDISADVATKPFQHDVRSETDVRLDVLSMGFASKNQRGYTTIGASLRAGVSLALPGQLFCILKEGPANKVYNLSSLSAHGEAFTEVALGHSHKIGDNLEIGAKAKLLFGLAKVDAMADGTQIDLGEDVWEATVNAEAQANFKGLRLVSDPGETTISSVEVFDDDKFGLSGLGAAFDLGATYTISDFKIGLAVLDLGGIKWNNTLLATTDGPHHVTTEGTSISFDDDDDRDYTDTFDELETLVQLQNKGDQGSRFVKLGATLNASVEYTLPTYSGLSFGLLSTTRFQGDRTWNEERLSINLAPTKWFALSVSGAVGTFGPSVGGMVSLHPKGFSLFAGMDYIGLPFSQEGLPLGSTVQANFGLVFPF